MSGIAHRKARRKHFLNRLKNRYFDSNGKSVFDDNDPVIIKQMITSGKCTVIRAHGDETLVVKVFYKGYNLPIVYDLKYK